MCSVWGDGQVGYINEDDGTFFMHRDDFLGYFVEVEVCDPWSLQKYSEDKLIRNDTCAGSLVAGISSGGRSRLSTFKYNPRYELTVNDTTCRLQILQEDIRGLNESKSVDDQRLWIPWFTLTNNLSEEGPRDP